jgi:hypothetical protein
VNGYPELMGDSPGAQSPKLRRTLLPTVVAAPVALAVRLLHGTTSSPRTMVRVLVHLAMLSAASGWTLPSTGKANAFSSHATMITGGVGGARDRRLLVGSSCDDSWCASPGSPVLSLQPCPASCANAAAAAVAAVIFVMAAATPTATATATATAMTAVMVVAMAFLAVGAIAIATAAATAAATAPATAAATPIVTANVTAYAIPVVPPALLASTAPQSKSLVARVPWLSRQTRTPRQYTVHRPPPLAYPRRRRRIGVQQRWFSYEWVLHVHQ